MKAEYSVLSGDKIAPDARLLLSQSLDFLGVLWADVPRNNDALVWSSQTIQQVLKLCSHRLDSRRPRLSSSDPRYVSNLSNILCACRSRVLLFTINMPRHIRMPFGSILLLLASACAAQRNLCETYASIASQNLPTSCC